MGDAMIWSTGRCPCCRKKTQIVLGALLNMTARGWDNYMSRECVTRHARLGICPWCGRRTTIVARILIERFEPTMQRMEASS
jgi:hypothetical protein